MEHLSKAWEVVSRDLMSWVIFFLVGALLMTFTCGLGAFVAVPAFHRAARKAVFEGGAPAVGDLFDFSHVGDDAVYCIIYVVGYTVSSFVPLIGPFLFMTIAFFASPLFFDGRYAPVDAFKASLAYVKLGFVDTFVLVLIGMVLGFCGAICCYVGLFVTGPVSMVMTWVAYAALQSQILAAAQAEGIPALR